MAKLSLNIDERTVKNGMAHVRLRINHRGTSAFVSTGVYIEPQYFIPNSLYDPVHRKAYLAAEKRDKIAGIVRRIDEWLSEVDRDELQTLTATNIRERACAGVRKRASAPVSPVRAHDFVSFFGEYGESRQTEKTRESYAYALKVLRDYCEARSLGTLLFVDIDYPRLVDFARWLRENGKGEATRHMLESYVRAAYKDGQKRRMVSRDLDPYYDYSIAPVPPKDIDCLTADQMHALLTLDVPQAGLQMARDIALMSFMLCGHNLIDLYEMPEGEECVFVRHKIARRYQREIHIRIEPELAALVERWKGNGMLLCFKATYPNYDSFRHKVAHRLRELKGVLGFEVSMPKIRRTWATIAAALDVPDRVIDKSMGHVDATVKDRHYEQYDWSRTAEANRKVLDFIKKYKKL